MTEAIGRPKRKPFADDGLWPERAACRAEVRRLVSRGVKPNVAQVSVTDLFYPTFLKRVGHPPKGGWPDDGFDPFLLARAFCDECTVRAECLEQAVVWRDAFAMRGGRTPDEIRVLISERVAEPVPYGTSR